MNYSIKNIILLTALIISCSYVVAQEEAIAAANKVYELKSASTKFHNISTSIFLITDINKDGIFEVIERVNEIENQSLGLLNIEMYPAFLIDKIYKYTNGVYVENYADYREYLNMRKEHFKLWKKLIENPELLSDDSKSLIKFNKDLFLYEITRIIASINKKMQQNLSKKGFAIFK